MDLHRAFAHFGKPLIELSKNPIRAVQMARHVGAHLHQGLGRRTDPELGIEFGDAVNAIEGNVQSP